MPHYLPARSVPRTPHELIRRARASDSVGIGGIYDLYADALFRTAYRISGSRSDAEDIVHDLFVGLPDALKRYDDRGQLGAWLARIVVRMALMRARADRRQRVITLDAAFGLAARDASDADLNLTEVHQAVMALPKGLRAVFMLKQVEGYSHEEIAALLSISTGASRVRLTRAVKILRGSLR